MQRRLLIKIISAYRTISTEAAQVISAIEPIDLKIRMKMKVRDDRRRGVSKEESTVNRTREIVGTWRWEDSLRRRETYRYIPDTRRDCSYWEINHYVTQGLSGHGNYNERLHSFGLKDSPMCELCGVNESMRHVIFECEMYGEERLEMRDELEEKELNEENVMKEEHLRTFFKMVKNIMKVKEALE